MNSESPGQNQILSHLLSRRAALAAATGTALTIVGAVAQQSSPVATPAGTPVATPQGTPEPALVAPTPVPDYPLKVILEQQPPWAGQPTRGGELRLFVKPDYLNEFTPTRFQQDFGVTVSYLDPLVWADQVTLEPSPWLARSWQWSSDGLSLKIVLRDGILWHDGTPFTADDVRFSLLCYRDDYDSAVAFMLSVVRDVEVNDELELTVLFDEPDGNFPFNAANLPIFSRAQWEDHWLQKPLGERTLSGMDFGNDHPLGTGAWIIDQRSDDQIRLRRNDQHFAAVPWADSLVLDAESDFDRKFEAWKDNETSLIWPFPGREVQANLQEPGFLVAADSTLSYFAAFNFGNPLRIEPGLMALPGLREAMNLAINRQDYAESIFGGMIDVDRAGFMTQPWAIDPEVRNPKRDVDTARTLLTNNGWTDWDGDGILDSPTGDRGAFVCIVREDADSDLLAILDTLDADLREIGLTIEIQQLPVDEFTDRWMIAYDYDLIALQLNQYPAFNEFDLVGAAWSIRRNQGGWNPGGYWNADVDLAVVTYLQTVDIAEMKSQLQIIQERTNSDLFALWLGFPKQPVLIRPDIAGFQPNKMWQSWNTWALWQDGGASVITPTPLPPTPTPVPPTPTPSPTPTVPASPAASPIASPESATPQS